MNKVFKQIQRHEFLTYSTSKYWKRNPSLLEFTEFSDFYIQHALTRQRMKSVYTYFFLISRSFALII